MPESVKKNAGIALTKGYKHLLNEARARVRTVSLEEARARHGNYDTVFVDIRDVRELERDGTIPGAFHAPRGCWSSGSTRKVPTTRKSSVLARILSFTAALRGGHVWQPPRSKIWA
jgi:hypothetical protein